MYGKVPRPGRKVGQVTLRADDPAELATRLEHVATVRGTLSYHQFVGSFVRLSMIET
ncbi:MAG TPA: hypothetical protein VNA04_17855 [Thermoanaerobaculia bacterium]|nr:hypothetical protein [Thermoanaerobaculia bacterium]